MLIATEESNLIDKWIIINARNVNYDVRIVEVSSFGNPDELGAAKHHFKISDGVSLVMVDATRVFSFSKNGRR